jgi:tetratricopeptide (TPR) repeat protein
LSIGSKAKWGWILPVGIVLAIAFFLILSNRQPTNGQGLPKVDTMQAYRDELFRANDLIAPVLAKARQGKEPTDQEKANLLEGAQIIENASSFLPNRAIPYESAGEAYFYADQYDLAELNFKLCLQNVAKEGGVAAVEAGNQSHYLLSQTYAKRGDYKRALAEARLAVRGQPNSADYMAALASVEVQLGDLGEAGRHVAAALTIDPENGSAGALRHLLETSPDYLAVVAEAMISKRKLDEARIVIDQALELDPQHKKTLQLKKKLESLSR